MRKVLLAVLILLSCHAKEAFYSQNDFYQGSTIFKDEDFMRVTVPYHDIDSGDLLSDSQIVSLAFAGKNPIIVTENRKVTILDEHWKLVQVFGNGAGDSTMNFVSPQIVFAMDSAHFYVHDLTLDKLFEFSLDPVGKKWAFKQKIKLIDDLKGLTSIQLLPDSTFIGTSINNIGGKIIHFALFPEQRVLNYVGQVPAEENKGRYVTGMEYRSSCIYDPVSSQAIVAYFYTDELQCYKLSGDSSYKLHGPDQFKPIFKVIGKGAEQRFANTSNTIKAYKSITQDETHVYALYNEKAANDMIYIFSKSGTPLKKIATGFKISRCYVDRDNQRLYCFRFNDSHHKLIYYDLPAIDH